MTFDKMAYTVYFSQLLCAQMLWRTEWQCCFRQGHSVCHSNSTGCSQCTTCRIRGLARTCFGLSAAKHDTQNLKAPLQTQQIYGLS